MIRFSEVIRKRFPEMSIEVNKTRKIKVSRSLFEIEKICLRKIPIKMFLVILYFRWNRDLSE